MRRHSFRLVATMVMLGVVALSVGPGRAPLAEVAVALHESAGGIQESSVEGPNIVDWICRGVRVVNAVVRVSVRLMRHGFGELPW